MEKKRIYILFGIAVCFLVPGLWMFYVAPTIWWVDAVQRDNWFRVATILTGLGTFIILVVSSFVAGILYGKKGSRFVED